MLKKIGFKLTVAVVVMTLIIISVYYYLTITTNKNVFLQEVERHSVEFSETIVSSARYAMMLNQMDQIDSIIKTVGRQRHIQNVRILNKEGRVVYSSNHSEVNKLVDKKNESCYGCHEKNEPLERVPSEDRTRIFKLKDKEIRVLGVITPIYNDRSCWESDCHAHNSETKVLGVLDVTTSIEIIDNQIESSLIKNTIFAFFTILILSSLIGLLIRKWVSNPIKDLLKATNQIASGNLNVIIKDKSDDEFGVLANSFNNMTKKLSEAKLQLFQSDKMASLGKLAAGVAHEINNPLTGVLTYSSFLLKRTKGDDDMQQSLGVIVRETERCREIVKGLLDFARQSVPKKSSAQINEIIERAIVVVENKLQLNNIKIIKQFDSNLPDVIIDSNQMQQVFINLIVNAGDAIDKNGTIKVSVKLEHLPAKGNAQIKNARCSKRHDLMDHTLKIDGLPSVKVKVIANGNEGFLNLDPIYGMNRNILGIEIEDHKQAQFMCPTCSNSLIVEEKSCPICSAPIYGFEVAGQGFFEGCSRKECEWRKWDYMDKGDFNEYIEIKVSDTGCGIDKEDINKIFDPFFSTKGQKGTGLGLAVIWGIIDNHNGKIKVESEKGKGTTFIIHLPLSVR